MVFIHNIWSQMFEAPRFPPDNPCFALISSHLAIFAEVDTCHILPPLLFPLLWLKNSRLFYIFKTSLMKIMSLLLDDPYLMLFWLIICLYYIDVLDLVIYVYVVDSVFRLGFPLFYLVLTNFWKGADWLIILHEVCFTIASIWCYFSISNILSAFFWILFHLMEKIALTSRFSYIILSIHLIFIYKMIN